MEYPGQGEQSHQPRGRSSSILMGSVLVGLGVLVGLVIASDLEWLPFGHAVRELERPAPVSRISKPPAPVSMPGGRGRDFVQVAKSVKPSVVNIFSTRSGKTSREFHGAPSDDPFFRRFFGDEFLKRFEAPQERRKERGLGSGVIVDARGVIITNNHVVKGADVVKVFLADKTEYEAELIGVDSKTDLAVLKVEANDLPTIPWADSDHLEVGEYVLAVGNPFGLNQTVTMGIVSAVGRARMGIAEYEDFIQTDAAINPGNSGGALVNARGELVGINTAIFSRSGGNMGIGFAVPSNMARAILDQLVTTGKVVRGWLGVSIQDLSPELALQFAVPDPKGVLVSDVLQDSPAERAGLARGDVIMEFDGKVVEDATQLRNVVAVTEVGRAVEVKVIRNRHMKTLKVKVGEQPTTIAQAQLEESGRRTRVAGVLADIEVSSLDGDLAEQYGLVKGERGVMVVEVKAGSIADEAGLRAGDLILEVNRAPVPTLDHYHRLASRIRSDQTVLLLIQRRGRASFLTLKP